MKKRSKPRLPRSGFAALAAMALMAGCASSPPARHYTLVMPQVQAPQAVAAGDYLIEVVPVSVAAQVDRPQLMLRSGEGQLAAQYSERWSSPLPDELRNALADALTRRLGVPDVRGVRPAAGTPLWRVQVDVQRFDASVAGPAVVDATWRVRPMGAAGRALLCRSWVDVPVAPASGVDGVVAALQHAVALLGDTIASAVRSQGAAAEPASPAVQILGCTAS